MSELETPIGEAAGDAAPVDEAPRLIDAFAIRFRESAEAEVGLWRESTSASLSPLDGIRETHLDGVRSLLALDGWGDSEPPRRELDLLRISTAAAVARPISELGQTVDLGEALDDLFGRLRALLGAEVEAHAPEPELAAADEWVAYAYLTREVRRAVVTGIRRQLAAAAEDALERHARLGSVLTRWTRLLLGTDGHVDSEHEVSRPSSDPSPVASDPSPEPTDRSAEPPDASSEDARAPAVDGDEAAQTFRDRLDKAGEDVAAALSALADFANGDVVLALGVSIGERLDRANEEFAPTSRKWRSAGADLAEKTARAALAAPTGDAAGDGAVTTPSAPGPERPLYPPERFDCEWARAELCDHLLGFDAFLRTFVADTLLSDADAALAAASDHLSEAAATIRQLHREAESSLSAESGTANPDMARLLRRGRAALARAGQATDALSKEAELSRSCAEGLGALMARVGELPWELRVAPLVDDPDDVKVGVEGRRLEVRDWAEEAIDPPLLDRLARSPEPYVAALTDASATIPRVSNILEYNIGAAAQTDELPAEGALELQRELVFGGLARSADRLDDAVGRLAEARREAPARPEALLATARRRFRDRAEAEGGVEGHARDALGAMRQSGRRTAGVAARHWARGSGAVGKFARTWLTRAQTELRRARSAVGATPVDEARADQTARELSQIDASAERLPFVYRRLFTYRPLEDPALLVGRDAECEILDAHLSAWEEDASDATLLVGTSGVGVTSLLYTTRERWYGRVEWRTVQLARRIEDEAEWAGELGRALGLEPAPRSLAEVERALTGRERPAVPQVCAIENLEHLYFRGVLAAGLIASTLKLVSATDGQVLWLASVPASAWEVVKATDPGLSALLRVLVVKPVGRADVEAAVLARHQRSGIPLAYEESSQLPMGVRRALARAEKETERVAILRGAFFDRLYELSEGYIALALLYWLRAIDDESSDESMRIRWPQPIDFAAWEDLHADAGFALRALLEHGSLTLQEYARLMGVGETIAFATFERLGGLLIIEPLGETRRVGSQLAFRRVDAARRYRIRPVLVRPVERLLIARRLLY